MLKVTKNLVVKKLVETVICFQILIKVSFENPIRNFLFQSILKSVNFTQE